MTTEKALVESERLLTELPSGSSAKKTKKARGVLTEVRLEFEAVRDSAMVTADSEGLEACLSQLEASIGRLREASKSGKDVAKIVLVASESVSLAETLIGKSELQELRPVLEDMQAVRLKHRALSGFKSPGMGFPSIATTRRLSLRRMRSPIGSTIRCLEQAPEANPRRVYLPSGRGRSILAKAGDPSPS